MQLVGDLQAELAPGAERLDEVTGVLGVGDHQHGDFA
jgi:hypothetical protein